MENISSTNEKKKPREKVDGARIDFRRLSDDCQWDAFSCGYVYIDDFFRRLALDEHNAFSTRVMTAHIDGGIQPVAFYAMHIISEPASYYASDQGFLAFFKSKFMMGVLHSVELKWMAVASEWQRRGIGSLLMGRALDDFHEVAIRTGVSALTVHPISSNARIFYGSLGFQPYGAKSERMYLAHGHFVRYLTEANF